MAEPTLEERFAELREKVADTVDEYFHTISDGLDDLRSNTAPGAIIVTSSATVGGWLITLGERLVETGKRLSTYADELEDDEPQRPETD